MKKIDLHIHTSASDGDFSPKEIIDLAEKRGMKIIAITDHDTLAGIEEARDYAVNKNIEVTPGIEISCESEELKLQDIHILGLFVNQKNEELNELVEKLKKENLKQKEGIIKNLRNLGFDISIEEVKKEFGESLSRPNIAKILIKKYPEKFKEVMQVFHELIGKGKKAFVEQRQALMDEAIKSIHSAGGVAILAHPGIYIDKSKELIEKFIKTSGDGIEVEYPYEIVRGIEKEMSDKLNKKFRGIAESKNLLISGGSDFHGPSVRAVEIGDKGIDDEEFKKLKDRVR